MTPLPQCFEIKDAPGKGLGMFATRDIRRGECVLSEKPLVYAYHGKPLKLEQDVEALSEGDKGAFFALHNARLEFPTVVGIAKTNALPLGPDVVDSAVYKVMSRVNHSCVPNVHHVWNSKHKKENLFAHEDIAKGSEILTCYTALFMVREERMSYIRKNFKFECPCGLCEEASPEYDRTVSRIKILKDLIPKYATLNPKKSIQLVREVVALVDGIGNEGKPPFYYDGYQISAMYGDYRLAQEWADLLVRSYVMEEGQDGDRYERYLRYSQNPRSHERAGCAPRQILS